MKNWDEKFVGLAAYISTWSKDPSTRVGAVIADPKRHNILALGYNGFPRGIRDDERLQDRAKKYPLIVHAEMNALLSANASVLGAHLYCYPMGPCQECAKAIIQAGIIQVIFPPPSAELQKRWGEDFKRVSEMFAEAGVMARPPISLASLV